MVVHEGKEGEKKPSPDLKKKKTILARKFVRKKMRRDPSSEQGYQSKRK